MFRPVSGSEMNFIHHLDRLASENKRINGIHPVIKLVLTFAYTAVVMSLNRYNAAGIIICLAWPLILFPAADLSITEAFKRLRFILPLIFFLGIFNPFFDSGSVAVGNIRINAGLVSMFTLVLKGIGALLAGYLLIATTSAVKLCLALRCLHVPKIIVIVFMLVFRYISVLSMEVNSLVTAYSLRAPGQKGIRASAWGGLAGQLLIRSMDRASVVYESMKLRGFSGDFSFAETEHRGRA